MRLAVIAVTRRGAVLSKRLAGILQGSGHACDAYVLKKYFEDGEVMQSFGNLSELVGEIFTQYDGLVFLCACGIAVRSIAKHLESKTTDPAVLAIDEQGKFVVSLLSGHIGGANALTEQLADAIGAQAVVTTATDTGRLFSPDSFAKANDLYITDMEMAKAVAVAVLHGEPVGVCSNISYINLPKELTETEQMFYNGDNIDKLRIGIYIGAELQEDIFMQTLHLIPKDCILGVGCRKGIAPEDFEGQMLDWLSEHGISMRRIGKVATIDLKKEEPAVLAFCEKYRLPFETFSAEELMAVGGEWTASEFVRQTTGADNVCERSAMACEGAQELLVRKQAGGGVTMAVALRYMELDFRKSSA